MLYNAERKVGADLMVIKMEGWRRADYFDATALNWVNPSPNMRSLTQAVIYPGIGLLETTNLSVGRGTDTPFEVIGVVKDVRNAPFGQPVEPALYFTTRQYTFREQSLAVKATDRAAAVAANSPT